jgi:hypothetical protein
MSTLNRSTLIPVIILLALVACNQPVSIPTTVPEGQILLLTKEPSADFSTPEIKPSATPELQLSTPVTGVAQPLTLHIIKMLDVNHGWASASGDIDQRPHLVATSDGGVTWKEMTPAGMTAEAGFADSLILFTFLDANRIWATLSSWSPSPTLTSLVTWQTVDGGNTWSSSDPLAVTDLAVEFFMPDYFGFSDQNNGWLLVHNGAGMNHDYVTIFTSANGGASWKRVVDPYQDNLMMSCSKTGLTFFDAARGWITIDCHGVKNGLDFYTSLDGGNTWQEVSLPSPGIEVGYFENMDNACGLDGIVYAADPLLTVSVTCMHYGISDPDRWLYSTTNKGASWVWNAAPGGYGEAFFLTPSQGWFLGHLKQQESSANTLYATSDGGISWTPVKNVNWSGMPFFADAQNGWVIARAGTETAFVRTNNGGKTWAEIKAVITP